MKKLFVLSSLVLLCSATILSAQSADRVTDMIKAKTATYGQIAYMSAVYQELVPESATEKEAVAALAKAGVVSKNVSSDKDASLSAISYISARTFNMKGGLWYSIHPSARYAFRQLKADQILPASADPSEKVSGREALNVFNSCMSAYAKDEKKASK